MRARRRLTIFCCGAIQIITLILILHQNSKAQELNSLPVTSEPLSVSDSNFDFDLSSEADMLASESYILLELESGRVLAAQNPDLKRPPASTTKLLTGLVVMQTLQEDDLVEVGEEVNVEGSKLGLEPGDRISVGDLLTAMYVTSANDAAAALAVKTSGSIAAFGEDMNQYARSVGANNSNFTNPHGLPELAHYTTASDLAKIAVQFIKNDSLINYVQQEEAQIVWQDSTGARRSTTVRNTNQLLGVYPGVEGLKTGTTQEAGQCLVTYLNSPDGDLLLILLGSEQRYSDTITLLDEGRSILRTETALKNVSSDPQTLFNSPGFFGP